MNEAEKVIFDTWRNDKLSVFIGALKAALLEAARPMPIEVFNGALNLLARLTCESFVAAVGAESLEKIPENFRHNLLAEIVSGFNSVLPDGFPYVVAALFSKSEPEKIRIGFIKRDIIPGTHDIISKKILFIVELELENELPDGKCAIMGFHVDRISFSGGEKLPEF